VSNETAPLSSDDELVIETPERVELYYMRAQIGNRFLAALLDHIIQFTLVALIVLALVVTVGSLEDAWKSLSNWAIALAILAVFLILAGYFVIFETLWNGQTPGKRIFGLRVIREDGRPIRFYEATVRNLIRFGIDAMPLVPFPLYSIGIMSVFFSARSKRLGDYVAGTVVIRESEAHAPTLDEVVMRAREVGAVRGVESPPFRIDPRKLGDKDVLALRVFLRRRFDLPPDIRQMLGHRLVASLAAMLSVPPVQLSPEAVLEEIDRQCRAYQALKD
jgi:uncharacterized RDD family membrane protein YckC